jgi:NAD(P)-dependent dehydrogenase (short-subunit alcohol dehydrogenase family)
MSELGTILVTGGASGLGAAVISAVAAAGGTPVGVDRTRCADGVEQEIVDLADARAAEDAVRAVSKRLGGLDGVVTCAGIDACGKLEDVPGADWDRVIQVNLIGTAAVIRAALPDLLERRGHVITVASTLGVRALPDATAYSASKFGVVGLTRALAAETQGRIGTTLLIPGGMRTRFFEGRDPQYMPADDAPLNAPENVAAAVVFALSQPSGCEVRELVVTPSVEGSWP